MCGLASPTNDPYAETMPTREELMAAQSAKYAQADARSTTAIDRYSLGTETTVADATEAWTRGDRFFQCVLAAADAAAVLGSIEGLGWRLETAGYVFVPTSTSGTGVSVAGVGLGGASTWGGIAGVYLFRRG